MDQYYGDRDILNVFYYNIFGQKLSDQDCLAVRGPVTGVDCCCCRSVFVGSGTGLDWTGEMHKFYWRNTHGPGARRTQDQTVYRMGKSGSADNILSEVNIIRVV